jgi:ATP/maltotriose-dependent transcriptional regulator MalT
MMVELLSTKFYIPRPRTNRVSRPRLIERLNAGLDRKLTLIAAPAGFGKTTLLSEWIPLSSRQVAWLSLDENDQDPILFWTYFISALQALRLDLGDSALALLQSPQGLPIPAILTALINDLNDFPDPFVAVLDDYHLIDSQPIHEGLSFLIAHQPDNLHLVITTRADPPLPLARLRARNTLNELRANDLRFTAEETAVFLTWVMGLNLSAREIAALEERTEGWIAGLQIAALSMQSNDDIPGFIKAFSGSHRHILGYLADEVLDQQPKGTLDFLLETSILERLCGPLCDAVTENSDGHVILEKLEHGNLFITALDNEGVWYRYHPLFAEVLQQRLRQSLPDRWPELHRAASIWHEQSGSMAEAVSHAMAAQDFDRAADLVEAIGITQFAQPTVQASLQGWLAMLPEAITRNRPRLSLIRAWQLFDRADIAAAIRAVDEAERAVEPTSTDLEAYKAQNLRGATAAMRAFLHTFTREPDLDQVMASAQTALACLAPDSHNFRGLAAAALAFVYVYRGGLTEVERASGEAAAAARVANNVYLATFNLVSQILMVRAQGRYSEAMALCREALQWMVNRGAKNSPSMSSLNTVLADLLREVNDLDDARYHAELGLIQADNGFNPIQAMFSRFTLARVKQAQGEWDGALELLAQVSARLAPNSPMLHPSLVAATTAQWQLMHDHLDPAFHWAQTTDWIEGSLASIRTSSDLIWRCEHVWIAHAQVFIAEGRARRDRSLLEKARAYIIQQQAFAEATGLTWLRIKLLALYATVSQALGEESQTIACLQQALFLAEPERYVRIFVDEGEPMRLLLLDYQSNLKKKLSDSIDGVSIRLLTYTDNLLASFSQPVPGEKSNLKTWADPLSERELEILRLISLGFTNQEIAHTLVIAVSTVKSHINNLYSKLGTSRRTQAIAIARDLGLLSN